MRAVDLLKKKRDGRELTAAEIDAFVHAATHGTWHDYQLSAMLMAICIRGMDDAEMAHFTLSMSQSGKRYRWDEIPGPKVDKHSTGGVGDKTSLIIAPLAAACGAIVPMMSGRGLGHTGGTLDKLESIPGFRTDLDENELRAALLKVGAGMIGQSAKVAPADRKLYALRDVTGTVESIPLITASILSKKLAEGIDSLVLDVKVGRGAFMRHMKDAKNLADAIVTVGAANQLRTEALITAMDHPLGRTIGNSVEVIECVETLKGRGPRDLEQLSLTLTARMLRLAGLADDNANAEKQAKQALASGAGLEKFRALVAAQGGDPRILDDYSLLPTAPRRHVVRADKSGYVTDLHAHRLGRAAMLLGAGRHLVSDAIDHSVGILLHCLVGGSVKAGDPIMELHYTDDKRLHAALELIPDAVRLDVSAPTLTNLIHETVTPRVTK